MMCVILSMHVNNLTFKMILKNTLTLPFDFNLHGDLFYKTIMEWYPTIL